MVMCNIVVYKKYIHILLVIPMNDIYFSDRSGPHLQFPAQTSQNSWNFLSNKSSGIIFGLLSSVPENASGSEG